ncbi:MAG: thiol-disulfide oxidoreductase DCC family protein, partial [Candidatus Binataceae bacterium]
SIPVRVDRLPPALIDLLGAGAIAVESGFLFLVLFRWSRWFLIPAGLAFHAGNGALLGIWFTTLITAYVAMVDWTWLARRALKIAGQEQVLVLYDGSCELCRRTIAILKTFDMCGALVPVPGLSDDPRRLANPEITDAMLLRDLYTVGSGGVAAGYDAYKTMTAVIPVLWPLSLIMRLPPIAAIGTRIYRGVAESRHCPIERPSPAERDGQTASRWLALQIVGAFLVLAEAVTIGMYAAFPARSNSGVDRPASMVSRIGDSFRGARLKWPFDIYPTFAGRNDGTYRCFEFELVSIDGAETSVSPEVFASMFGDWAVAAEDMLKARVVTDPSRRRALAIARMLWRKMPPNARQGIVGIRGYDAIYSTDPEHARLINRNLIDNFPVSILESPADATRSGPSDAIVEVRP